MIDNYIEECQVKLTKDKRSKPGKKVKMLQFCTTVTGGLLVCSTSLFIRDILRHINRLVLDNTFFKELAKTSKVTKSAGRNKTIFDDYKLLILFLCE
jgi:hypothetical protein